MHSITWQFLLKYMLFRSKDHTFGYIFINCEYLWLINNNLANRNEIIDNELSKSIFVVVLFSFKVNNVHNININT